MALLNNIEISGIVIDAKTNEPVINANIYLKLDRTNTIISNNLGRFLLEVDTENTESVLVISCAGYEKYQSKILLTEDVSLKVKLYKRQNKSDRAQLDEDLVQKALSGDNRAYGKLMSRYRDSIYFMIQKMVNNRDDAEDLTIEAFGKAFHNLKKYSSEYAFSTWLYRIAINNCIDFVRKNRIETFSLDVGIEDEEGGKTQRNIEANELDPEEKLIKQQRILHLRSVIEQLNPKYRRLIELRYLQEKSYDEIATELQRPLGTVKAQLYRAKELMTNIIDKNNFRY